MSNKGTKRTRDAAELPGTAAEPRAKRGCVDNVDNKGESALHLAAERGHEDIVGLLLLHGADITLKNKNGMTPFDLAKSKGHESVAQLLEEWKQFSRVMNEAKKTEAKTAEAKTAEAKTAEAKTAETPAYTPPPKGVYEGVASLDEPYVPTSPLDGMPYDISL